METMERLNRLHAQTLAGFQETFTEHNRKFKVLDDDYAAYKTFITGVHSTIDEVMTARLDALQQQVTNIMDVVPRNVEG